MNPLGFLVDGYESASREIAERVFPHPSHERLKKMPAYASGEINRTKSWESKVRKPWLGLILCLVLMKTI